MAQAVSGTGKIWIPASPPCNDDPVLLLKGLTIANCLPESILCGFLLVIEPPEFLGVGDAWPPSWKVHFPGTLAARCGCVTMFESMGSKQTREKLGGHLLKHKLPALGFSSPFLLVATWKWRQASSYQVGEDNPRGTTRWKESKVPDDPTEPRKRINTHPYMTFFAPCFILITHLGPHEISDMN